MAVLLTIVLAFSGLTIGFLAQRSRMCFVAGFRDFLIVRDKELLMGLVSFVVTVWILTSVFSAAGLLNIGVPLYGEGEATASGDEVVSSNVTAGSGNAVTNAVVVNTASENQGQTATLLSRVFTTRFFYVTVVGGFLIGLLSVFAGGCVMRQHVLLAQGSRDALYYLAGFYVAGVCFYSFLQPVLSWVYE